MAYRDLPGRRAPATEPDWLTLGQAAKYLGVAQSTIRKWSDQGRVPAFYTPGGHRRYRRGDLDKFLESSGPGAREQAGPTVLVVDDDDRMREYMRASLELEGYSVLEAGNAEEGLAVLESEHQPQLILLDVMMPGTDGWEMLQRIQERHGSIPVIMFSGQVDEQSAARAEERGASAFVGKPFDPQYLIDQAKQILPLTSTPLERWVVRTAPSRSTPSSRSRTSGATGSSGTLAGSPSCSSPPALPARDRGYASCRERADAIKIAVDRRVRPLTRSSPADDASFPSGHAATSFACAATLAVRRRAPPSSYVLAAGSRTRASTSACTTRSTCSPARRSGCSSLQLFGCFQQPCDDHRQRSEQADPDPDPAVAGRNWSGIEMSG